jgi:hypothetical protein
VAVGGLLDSVIMPTLGITGMMDRLYDSGVLAVDVTAAVDTLRAIKNLRVACKFLREALGGFMMDKRMEQATFLLCVSTHRSCSHTSFLRAAL